MIDAELRAHEQQLARRGVEVWVGAEPTFTRADSLAPAWLTTAEGDDKLERAEALARGLAARSASSSTRGDRAAAPTTHFRSTTPTHSHAAPNACAS